MDLLQVLLVHSTSFASSSGRIAQVAIANVSTPYLFPMYFLFIDFLSMQVVLTQIHSISNGLRERTIRIPLSHLLRLYHLPPMNRQVGL